MDTAATRPLNASRLTAMVAALVAAMVSASAVHAGDAKAARATTLLALQYSPDEPTLASNLAVLEARNLAASATVSTVK